MQGPNVWWQQNDFGIAFFDHSFPDNFGQYPKQPELHHFRSSNAKKECQYLQTSWEICMAQKIIIPANILKFEDLISEKIELVKVGYIEKLQGQMIDDIVNSETLGINNSINDTNNEDELIELTNMESVSNADNLQINGDENESLANESLDKGNESSTPSVMNEINGTTDPTISFNISKEFTPVKQLTSTPVKENKSNQCLETKEAKNIMKALGYCTPDIIKLDKLKAYLKLNPKSKASTEYYLDVLFRLQTQVSKCVHDLKLKLLAWEKDFSIKNFATPLQKDREKSEFVQQWMKQIKYGNFLMTEAWHMNL